MSKVTKISITAKHVSKAISMDCADLSITQEFSPTWATEQAYGKMDPIATFSHTGRAAAFEFVLLATNIKEAIRSINQISISPVYRNTCGRARFVSCSPPIF